MAAGSLVRLLEVVAGEMLLGRGAGGMGFCAEEMMRAGCAQLLLQESTWKGKKQPGMAQKGLCWTLRHSQGSTHSSQLCAWTWGSSALGSAPSGHKCSPCCGWERVCRQEEERTGWPGADLHLQEMTS